MTIVRLLVALLLALPLLAQAYVISCDQVACKTSAGDTVPRFDVPATMQSARNGNWTDPATWSTGTVPTAADIVQIAHAVVLNGQGQAQIIGVQAGGSLTFQPDVPTQLTVDTLVLWPQSTLTLAPQAGIQAEMVFTDVPLDPVKDPGQYGGGLLTLDATVTIRGAEKTSFVRLAAEPKANSTTLQLSEPVKGWQAGDSLFLPDSHHFSLEMNQPYAYQGEYAIVSAISGDGVTITLQQPLHFDHPGARDATGVLTFLPHVANLTRNVLLRSANPSGMRGHTWFSQRSVLDLAYAEYRNLGRTTIDALTTTNVKGRYPLHVHHVYGSATPAPGAPQFRVIGNVIIDETRNQRHKWALTVHDSHYGLIQDNVVINAAGWGIGTEDGNETANLFAHNFVAATRGIGGRDTGEMGTGVWMRGPLNLVRDNIAANTMGVEGGGGYGHALFFFYLGTMKVPNYPGADTTIAGQYTPRDGNATPLVEFTRNETYGPGETGLTIWWLGMVAETVKPNVGLSTVYDFSVWNFSRYGYFGYHAQNLIFDGFKARGNPGVVKWDVFSPMAITYADYKQINPIIRHADIQNVKVGVQVGTFVEGKTLIEDSLFQTYEAVIVMTTGAPGSAPYGPTLPPKRTDITNVLFQHLPQQGTHPPYDISARYNLWNNSANLVKPDQIFVTRYNQMPGNNFQVFYDEQRPDFVVPQSSGNLAGSPEAGLTNQQNWDKYQLAIAGAVMPPTAVAQPYIFGKIVRGTQLAVPTHLQGQ